MPAKKPDLARRVRAFPKPPLEERRNYTSLRRMFFDLIVQEFNRSARDAAASLSRTLTTRSNKRAHRRGFTGESLYQRVIDRHTITFNQVDALALHYELPMAAILLFSRIRSEMEHGAAFGGDRAIRLLNGFRHALDDLEQSVVAAEAARGSKLEGDFDVYDHLDYTAFTSFRSALRKVLFPSDDQLGLPI